MPSRITALTQDQRDAIPAYVELWIEKGLSCEPADRALAEDGMRRCYEFAGLPWHGNVVWVGSPIVVAFSGPIAAKVLQHLRSVHDAVRGAVHDAVRGAVHGAVGDAVRGAVHGAVDGAVRGAVHGAVDDAVRGAVHDAVRGAVHDAVRGAVHGAVDGAVGGAVGDAVDGAVGDAVHDAVRDAVHGAVDGAVGDAVDGAVGDAVRNHWYYYFGGSWWGAWQAWRLFFRDATGLTFTNDTWDRAKAYEDASSAGWWWPHSDFVVVADRPTAIHREQVGTTGWGSHRLHSEEGPAIAFRDGWALYYWHGVRVPADLLKGWPVERILKEPNAEVRRCAIEALGWERFIEQAALRLVDESPDPGNPGNNLYLYDVPTQVYDVDVRVLLCTNATPERDGTVRRFGLTVPSQIDDAVTAAAWLVEEDRDTYLGLARAT